MITAVLTKDNGISLELLIYHKALKIINFRTLYSKTEDKQQTPVMKPKMNTIVIITNYVELFKIEFVGVNTMSRKTRCTNGYCKSRERNRNNVQTGGSNLSNFESENSIGWKRSRILINLHLTYRKCMKI